jgi:caffeoyl-CoA O-methyltransferase
MRSITLPGIEEYALSHTSPDPAAMLPLIEETYSRCEAPQMLSGSLVARLLQILVYALQPRLILEIGTFTGYSALSMAAVLPPSGRLITCELNHANAAIARKNISASPYADRITLEIGPALQTIGRLEGPFDLVFIDADKVSYLDYFEAVLAKLADPGIIAADNTLWNGDVMIGSSPDAEVMALRQFNQLVCADPRVTSVLLTVRDGVTLIRPVGSPRKSANGGAHRTARPAG